MPTYCLFLVAAAVDCGVLGNPVNGTVSAPTTTYDSVATYSCNAGYTLTGDDVRTCLNSGLWSGSEPMCTGKFYCIHYIRFCLGIVN